jgi:hypothetical protein
MINDDDHDVFDHEVDGGGAYMNDHYICSYLVYRNYNDKQ